MYENVVAAYLSRHFHTPSQTCCRDAEDRFYERFATPFPLWLAGTLRLIRKRKRNKEA